MGLLLDWCDGLLSAQKLARHMHNATRDGNHHPMIQRLAKVGAGGLNHSQQHLLGLLEDCGLQQLLTKPPGLPHQLLLPSTWIRLLHSHYPLKL